MFAYIKNNAYLCTRNNKDNNNGEPAKTSPKGMGK